jgi:hypothetical protein
MTPKDLFRVHFIGGERKIDTPTCPCVVWARGEALLTMLLILECARARAVGTALGNRFREREAVQDYWTKYRTWRVASDGTQFHFKKGDLGW